MRSSSAHHDDNVPIITSVVRWAIVGSAVSALCGAICGGVLICRSEVRTNDRLTHAVIIGVNSMFLGFVVGAAARTCMHVGRWYLRWRHQER